jgi:hypothetical protein
VYIHVFSLVNFHLNEKNLCLYKDKKQKEIYKRRVIQIICDDKNTGEIFYLTEQTEFQVTSEGNYGSQLSVTVRNNT